MGVPLLGTSATPTSTEQLTETGLVLQSCGLGLTTTATERDGEREKLLKSIIAGNLAVWRSITAELKSAKISYSHIILYV